MDREQPTELLPLLEGAATFDIVRRGYDPQQVHDQIERMEADLRIAIAERDATAVRTAEFASQLAAAHTQLEAMRGRLSQAIDPATPENVSERIKGMLALARQEATDAEQQAAEIRRKAHEETADLQARVTQLSAEVSERLADAEERAAAIVAEAEQQAATLLGDADERATVATTEAEQRATAVSAAAEQRAATLVAEAEQQAAKILADAQRQREEADAAAAAKRQQADEDFEITLRARRKEAAKVDAERQAAAVRAAEEKLAAAHAEAERLVASARQQMGEFGTVRSTVLSQLAAVRSILDRVPPATGATPEEWPPAEPR
jgi:hypothetical protein